MTGIPEDTEFEPFREACQQHRLIVQECRSCGRLRWPPRPICGYCYSSVASWAPVSGAGVLFSWTVVHARHSREFGPESPCVVALAELVEDRRVRLLAGGVGLSEAELRPGLAVAVRFQDRGEGLVLPYWAPARVESGMHDGPEMANV